MRSLQLSQGEYHFYEDEGYYGEDGEFYYYEDALGDDAYASEWDETQGYGSEWEEGYDEYVEEAYDETAWEDWGESYQEEDSNWEENWENELENGYTTAEDGGDWGNNSDWDGWEEHTDETTGAAYWYNPATGESYYGEV